MTDCSLITGKLHGFQGMDGERPSLETCRVAVGRCMCQGCEYYKEDKCRTAPLITNHAIAESYY